MALIGGIMAQDQNGERNKPKTPLAPGEISPLPPGLEICQALAWRASDFVSVAWSPNGRLIAAGGRDGCVWLFQVSSGEVQLLEGHMDGIRSVTWAPSSRELASGSDDQTVRVWDASTGTVLHTLYSGSGVLSVAWSPNGRRLAVGLNDGRVQIWAPSREKVIRTLDGHKRFTWALAWSPDGRALASGSLDKTIRIWASVTGELLRILKGHADAVRGVAWSPDSRALASISDDKTVRIWDPAGHTAPRSIEAKADWLSSLAWSPDGSALAYASKPDTLRIWDPNGTTAPKKLRGKTGWVTSLSWSPDSRLIAASAPGYSLGIWDRVSGRTHHEFIGCPGLGVGMAWSPNGHQLAFGGGRSIQILNLTGQQPSEKTLDHGDRGSPALGWSPDGRALASGHNDTSIRIWDAETGAIVRKLQGHRGAVTAIAWSPDGCALASGSLDKRICVWNPNETDALRIMGGHTAAVLSVAWSLDGRSLASGSEDRTIRIWDTRTGNAERILEGHTDRVTLLAWSDDGALLVSGAGNGELRLWRISDGVLLAQRDRQPYRQWPLALFFGVPPFLKRLSEGIVVTNRWKPAASAVTTRQVAVTCAKVVLVGDSDVGKSCLALRLAEDRFEQRGTTHGMQIWTLPADLLHPTAPPPPGERRELFLWDLGGQAEYQLVHQLFLHDTTAALVLFDAARGEANYSAAEDWSRRLEIQGQGRPMRKLLVRSKLDLSVGVPDMSRVQQLVARFSFLGYYEVSALSGTGIESLRQALHNALAWDENAKITRPAVYQLIREIIQQERTKSAIVFYLELQKRLSHSGFAYTNAELDTVLEQLALEGQIVNVLLAQGDRVLVLRIDAVSRYAASLILAAREHPRGVPMLEPQRILSAGMRFPGINEEDRLDRAAERVVVECVVQLFLERGICLQHGGILVFPTLFTQSPVPEVSSLPHQRPLYYDFDGPIDNIYASLVARLAISGEWGSVRLWCNRAEYEEAGGGVLAVVRDDRGRGKGHLDLYVSNIVTPERRELFIHFVEDHLRGYGVQLLEGLAFGCECGRFAFDEVLLRDRLEEGKDTVRCPRCDAEYPLFRAFTEPKKLASRLRALKTETKRRTRKVVAEVKQALAEGAATTAQDSPIRLLHLSDLHLAGDRSVEQLLQPLTADLTDELQIERLDYIVVSGDLADRCVAAGFTRAHCCPN